MQTLEKVKERPIIMQPESVAGIMDGRKTRDSRIIKDSFNGCLTHGGPHPCPNDPVVTYPGQVLKSENDFEEDITIDGDYVEAHFFCSTMDKVAKCPYGKPGDILYCRETFHYVQPFGPESLRYGYCDGAYSGTEIEDYCKISDYERWRSPIFMPKAAARIWLRLDSIRVERIQDITQEGAIAEGMNKAPHRCPGWENSNHEFRDCYICPFKVLWTKINGPNGYGWDKNPWVWALSFTVLSTTGKPIL